MCPSAELGIKVAAAPHFRAPVPTRWHGLTRALERVAWNLGQISFKLGPLLLWQASEMQSHTEPRASVAHHCRGLELHGVEPDDNLELRSDGKTHRHIDKAAAQAEVGDPRHDGCARSVRMQFRRRNTAHSRERPALCRGTTRQPARGSAYIVIEDGRRERKVEDISFWGVIFQTCIPPRRTARDCRCRYQPLYVVASLLVFVADRDRVLELEGNGEAAQVQTEPAHVQGLDFLSEWPSGGICSQDSDGYLNRLSGFSALTHLTSPFDELTETARSD